MSDAEAVARVLGGDVDEFAELEHRYDEKVRACLYAMVGIPDIVEGLVQDTWVQAFEKLPRYNPSCSFGRWVCGFARKLAWEHRRDFARHCDDPSADNLPPSEEPSVPGPDEEFEERLAQDRAEKLLGLLAPAQAEAVRMRVCEGMSYLEMQVLTGRTERAMRNAVYHGLERLRAEMREGQGETKG